MNQTGVIFFGLLIGFVVFITLRGELKCYLGVIGLSSAVCGTTGTLSPAIANLTPGGGLQLGNLFGLPGGPTIVN